MMRRAATVQLPRTARGGMEIVTVPIWMEDIATWDLVLQLDWRGIVGKQCVFNETSFNENPTDLKELWRNKILRANYHWEQP